MGSWSRCYQKNIVLLASIKRKKQIVIDPFNILNMYRKYLTVVVLVAAFSAAQGGSGGDQKGWKIFEDCKDEQGLEWEDVKQVWKKEQWCEGDKYRGMSACILRAFKAWDGEVLSDAPAIESFGEGTEEYLVARKCYDWAETHQRDHQPCELMNCCKREGCGKRKRSRRSLFLF